MSIFEEISRLVGHSSSNVTETVHRHQIRPVSTVGTEGDGQDLCQRAVISVRLRDLNPDPLDANEPPIGSHTWTGTAQSATSGSVTSHDPAAGRRLHR